LDEPQLITSLRQGSEMAFKELVDLFKDRIYNTSLGFVQNEDDAEEITQEVFIKVFENIKDFRGDAKLSTWLYRIALTQSLEFLRRKKRKKRAGRLLNFFSKKEEEWHQPDFNHPGVAAEKKEMAVVLFKAIYQLPEQQQAAFLLQKTENLSQAEIADVMKTSIGAVESLLQRAKSNLKKLLEAYYQNHFS
jgi:RNA polymerase sigma-70 factor (ECF subfamily)